MILLIGGITLYKTFAFFEENKQFNVLKGQVPAFTYDTRVAITVDGEVVDQVPEKGLYETTVICTSGSGSWDYVTWTLSLASFNDGNRCTLAFTSNPRLTQDTLIANSKALRRNTYRGKDITEYFENGKAYEWISAGTFDDIYVGDYFKMTYDGKETTFLVADIDNYYGTGYDESSASCKVLNGANENCKRLIKHHITVIPAVPFQNAVMNDTNTTAGGYVGSKMFTTTLPAIETKLKTTFGNHLLRYTNLLSTAMDPSRISAGFGNANSGATSDWAWYYQYVDLMSETNVYGSTAWSSSGHDTGIDNMQYAIFQLKPELKYSYNGSYFGYWLKNVALSTHFAYASDGSAYGDASRSDGVRPRFLIG